MDVSQVAHCIELMEAQFRGSETATQVNLRMAFWSGFLEGIKSASGKSNPLLGAALDAFELALGDSFERAWARMMSTERKLAS